MISANELRIGNWLKVIKPNEGFQKVNPKTIFNILYANDDAEYKPIPLTPEILIAAGIFFKPPEWIKFVHELQNWFYWTNNKKELEINL